MILTTPLFRADFPALIKPAENTADKDNPKWEYSITMIFEDDETLKPFRDALEAAKTKYFPGGGGPASFDYLLRPGIPGDWDSNKGYDLKKYPQYAGKRIAVAKAKSERFADGTFDTEFAPIVVGPDPRAIFSPQTEKLYSGMWCRAEINIYRPKTGKGAGKLFLGLRMVQKCKDGEPLGRAQADPVSAFGEFVPPESEGSNYDLMDV